MLLQRDTLSNSLKPNYTIAMNKQYLFRLYFVSSSPSNLLKVNVWSKNLSWINFILHSTFYIFDLPIVAGNISFLQRGFSLGCIFYSQFPVFYGVSLLSDIRISYLGTVLSCFDTFSVNNLICPVLLTFQLSGNRDYLFSPRNAILRCIF